VDSYNQPIPFGICHSRSAALCLCSFVLDVIINTIIIILVFLIVNQ